MSKMGAEKQGLRHNRSEMDVYHTATRLVRLLNSLQGNLPGVVSRKKKKKKGEEIYWPR
jgi:hypothetical protein